MEVKVRSLHHFAEARLFTGLYALGIFQEFFMALAFTLTNFSFTLLGFFTAALFQFLSATLFVVFVYIIGVAATAFCSAADFIIINRRSRSDGSG